MSEKNQWSTGCALSSRRLSTFARPAGDVEQAHRDEAHRDLSCIVCGCQFTVPTGSDGGLYGGMSFACLVAEGRVTSERRD